MLHSNTNVDIHALTAGMVTKNRKRLMGYGMFISIELIINGINAITLSSIAKKVQKETTA